MTFPTRHRNKMASIRYAVPAAKISLINLILTGLIYASLIYASTTLQVLTQPQLIILAISGLVFINYVSISLSVPNFLKDNDLELSDGKTPVEFNLRSSFGMLWGLTWRSVIAHQILNLIDSQLEYVFEDYDKVAYFGLIIGLNFLMLYFAAYLLLKYPFGRIHIVQKVSEQEDSAININTIQSSNAGGDVMAGVIGILAFLGFSAYGVAQIAAGYMGIEYMFGGGWAIAALIASLGFRFTLPITIGAFFGATEVFGWHWAVALAFTAPGLLFIIPAFVTSIFSRK